MSDRIIQFPSYIICIVSDRVIPFSTRITRTSTDCITLFLPEYNCIVSDRIIQFPSYIICIVSDRVTPFYPFTLLFRIFSRFRGAFCLDSDILMRFSACPPAYFLYQLFADTFILPEVFSSCGHYTVSRFYIISFFFSFSFLFIFSASLLLIR